MSTGNEEPIDRIMQKTAKGTGESAAKAMATEMIDSATNKPGVGEIIVAAASVVLGLVGLTKAVKKYQEKNNSGS